MDNLSSRFKRVLYVFLASFILLISYLSFYYVFKGPEVVASSYNSRLWVKRNSILRGSIYDRDMNVLTEAKRNDDGSQSLIYHGGSDFAHILGYMHPQYGLTGLQNLYDAELMGNLDNGFMSIFSKGGGASDRGYDLKTTLNSELQKTAANALGDEKGAVVALNPKNGEILAMVSKPSYDPNEIVNKEYWSEVSNSKDMRLFNRAVSGMYPPGSTFKVVTEAAALESVPGILDMRIDDTGFLKYDGETLLENSNQRVLGNIGIGEALAQSSNVFFGQLGIDMGNETLKEVAERFYFNKDIPSDGIVIDNSYFPTWGKSDVGDLAQSAIGQSSVLSTPIQMALVAATVANDGVMMQPMLVNDVMYENKSVKKIDPVKIDRIISSENASILKEHMKDVVNSGTGGKASVSGTQVCGKTGTAENETGSSHSWFIGFAPYENPQIAFAVIIEEADGRSAASIAGEIVREALNQGLIK